MIHIAVRRWQSERGLRELWEREDVGAASVVLPDPIILSVFCLFFLTISDNTALLALKQHGHVIADTIAQFATPHPRPHWFSNSWHTHTHTSTKWNTHLINKEFRCKSL